MDILKSYQSYPQSYACSLDGRYFNLCLDEYEGLVKTPMHIYIAAGDNNTFESHIDMTESRLQLNPNFPDLIRVIIEVSKDDGVVSRHSNLIVVDSTSSTVYRFEPLEAHAYKDAINQMLKEYFVRVIPSYSFKEISYHPQSIKDVRCRNKGLCVAYVTLVALQIVYGNGIDYSVSYADIRKFVSAVEDMYNLNLSLESEADIEFGPYDVPLATVAGAIIGGPLLALGWGGALLGGAAGYALSEHHNR